MDITTASCKWLNFLYKLFVSLYGFVLLMFCSELLISFVQWYCETVEFLAVEGLLESQKQIKCSCNTKTCIGSKVY